jgi:hypothetical protein
MNTGQLINLLARDLKPEWSFSRIVALAVAMGALISGAAFLIALGFRPDIAQALHSWRFLLKFVLAGTLAVAATGMLSGLGRPCGAIGGSAWVAAIVPPMLVCAILVELATEPQANWIARLVGHNSRICLAMIPFLSAGPLLCFLLALGAGAPRAAGFAGAMAGVAAGGIGATFYSANCTDDSPLFVATWYPLAILAVSATGCLAGRLLLHW